MAYCGLCEIEENCSCHCHIEPVEYDHHCITSLPFLGKVRDEGPEPKRLDKVMKEQGLI